METSNCCGAEARVINGDASTKDYQICPQCGDHCEYTEEE